MNRSEQFHREPPQRRKYDGGALLVAALILALLAVGVVVGFGLLTTRQSRREVQKEAMEAQAAQQLAAHGASQSPAEPIRDHAGPGEAGEQIVPDADGKLLWASPTDGEPISLAYAPHGAMAYVYLRPAQLAAHAEGAKILAAMGPWGLEMAQALENSSDSKLEEIDGVLVSVIAAPDGQLDLCLRFDLLEAWSTSELVSRAPGDDVLLPERAAISVGDRIWFLASPDTSVQIVQVSRTLVVCPRDRYEELSASKGAPPLAPRDIESLIAQTDRERDATVIVSPKFLAAGGSSLVAGRAEPIRAALDQLVGRESTAVALSAHWGDSFFVELRAAPALGVSPRWLAATMRQRLVDAADGAEQYAASRVWPEYGRRVIERFPAMVRKLAEFTRYGEADRQAVLRAYLPAAAGHNLLMGAELLLTQAGGAAGRDVAGPASAKPVDATATLDERLAAPMSLSFPRESLERALELWSAESGVTATIDGLAFQAAGITRNQPLELDLHDRPAGEVLVEILRRANPDGAAASAADPRQSVVYVVEPAATGEAARGTAAEGAGGSRITVTTRAAAAARGRPLPAVFTVDGE